MKIHTIKIIHLSDLYALAKKHAILGIHHDAIEEEMTLYVTWGSANRTLVTTDAYLSCLNSAAGDKDITKFKSELKKIFAKTDYIDLEN